MISNNLCEGALTVERESNATRAAVHDNLC